MCIQDPTRPGRPGRTTLEDYLAFRDRAKSLCKLAAHAGIEAPLGNDDPAEVRAQNEGVQKNSLVRSTATNYPLATRR